MFKIRHKSTGKFVSKLDVWQTLYCLRNGNVREILAKRGGGGRSYNTRRGAEDFINRFPPYIRGAFEIVEFKEVEND